MSNWPARAPQDPRFSIRLSHQIALDRVQKKEPAPQTLMTLEEFQALDKRIVTADKVVENHRVNTWNQQFLYKTVNSDNLQSVFLDGNQKFQDLRAMLNTYNLEIREAESTGSKVRNGAWRSVFYAQLLELMREIMFTTNRELQAKFVDKAHAWATEKITQLDYQGRNPDKMVRPETGKTRPYSSNDKRPYSGATTKMGRPHSGYPQTSMAGETFAETTMNISFDAESAIKTIGEDGTVLGGRLKEVYSSILHHPSQPSDVIIEQMHDYNTHSRTKHDNVEPPKARLQNYKRRLISSIEPHRNDKKPPIPEATKPRTFPKPQSSKPPVAPIYEITAGTQLQTSNKESIENMLGTDIDGGEFQQRELEEIQKQVNEETKKTLISLEPRIKTFKSDPEVVAPREVKFETKSNFTVYVPTDKTNELRLEDRFIKARHREVQQKRQDEELVGFMKDWSQNKGRMEREINRRIESATYGNRFKEVQMKDRVGKEVDRVEMEKALLKHQKALRGEVEIEDLHLSDISALPEQAEDEEEEEDQEIAEAEYIEGDSEMIEQDHIQKKKKRIQQQETKPMNRVIDISEQLPKSLTTNNYKNGTDIHDLEQKMNNKHIEQVKKHHGALLGLIQPERETHSANESPVKLANPVSLSIFTQTANNKVFRPFSAAIEQCPVDLVRQEQLREIAEVKNRLARHKINIPMQRLMSAMLVPDQLTDTKGVLLPETGAGYMDRGEKKKAKKGKKKRRR